MKKSLQILKTTCLAIFWVGFSIAVVCAIAFAWFYIPARIQGRADSKTMQYSSRYEDKILHRAQQGVTKIYFEDIFDDFEWDVIAVGRCIEPEPNADSDGCMEEFPVLHDGDYDVAYPFDNFYTSPHLYHSIHNYSNIPMVFLSEKDKKAKLMYVFPKTDIIIGSDVPKNDGMMYLWFATN